VAVQEEYFSYNSYRNFYIDGGSGPAVLFLHPLGGSTQLWSKNLEFFLPTHRVLALDFLGFGRSDKPDIPYQISDFVERVIAFLDERKVEKAVLVGNSLGGHVATMLAHHYPTRVSGLVLANSSGLKVHSGTLAFWSVTLSAQIGRRLPINPSAFMIRSILKNIHGASKGSAEELTKFYHRQLKTEDGRRWKRAFVRALKAIVSTPIDEAAKEVDQPALIIWGTRDRLLGARGGELWAKTLQNAKLKELGEAGHFPQVESSEKFNEAVLSFLSSKA
jgi:pimeloyl-ACP methyl ester carboxylesterase